MNPKKSQEILEKVKIWFRESIVASHIKNTSKLTNPNEFNINPFLTPYIAATLGGSVSPENIARALVYPRALGTSITTSFGTHMQSFIADVLQNTFGSLVPGVDIEFDDALDGRHKFCQVKLGPNTINKDDVESIHGHFKNARNLGKTNKVKLAQGDLVIGILYGEHGQESNHYCRLRDEYDYPILIGADFWHRLTGHANFYDDLKRVLREAATEANSTELIENVITELAKTAIIKEIAGKM